jgi:chitodextrinase
LPTPDPSAPPQPPSAGPTDGTSPTTPQPLTGTAATTTVTLAWGASADDQGIAAYVVTRNGTTVATVTGTGWTDTGRAPKTSYTYTVTAVDPSANRSPAASLLVTTAADTKAPTVPGYFHRVRQSGRYVTFAWSRSTDNVRVHQYLIYRYGRSTPVARTTSLSIRIYTLRGATYYVRAVDAAGNRSSISRTVRIRY